MIAGTNRDVASCYVCGQRPGRYARKLDSEYRVYQCSECGLEYTTPVPSPEALREFYSHYHDPRADETIVTLNAREHLRALERHGWSPSAKTLDFGAGAGVFVREAGANCHGVEWGALNNERIKQSLSEFGSVEWDVATLWGVLEHLAHPVEVVSDLAARLRAGGMLALTTVDAEGTIPYYYKPPEHLSYWTRAAFEVLARRAGLEIVDYHPYRMAQLGAFYVSRLLSRTPAEYQGRISHTLPEVVIVPTNEVRVVMRKTGAPG